jgi:hypothetical protein
MEHFKVGDKVRFSQQGLTLYHDKHSTPEEMVKWRFEVKGFTKTSLVLKRLDTSFYSGNFIEETWSPMYFEVIND